MLCSTEKRFASKSTFTLGIANASLANGIAMINESRRRVLEERWQLLSADFLLTAPTASSLAKGLPSSPGTYLWTVSARSSSHCLYVGKCSNLAKRIYAYTQSFQPHAPNDRKLAFAQTALREQFAEAVFSLYFKLCGNNEINAMETAAIAEFSPLLNQLANHSATARAELEAIYQDFYRQRLGAALTDAS